MKQKLTDKLNSLFTQQNNYLDYEGLSVTFNSNAGVSYEDIHTSFSETGFNIPQDYIDFLKYCNGCTLYKYDDLGGFIFLGTNDLQKENIFQKETYEGDWDKDITVFCSLICEGSFIGFKNKTDGSYEILDCFHQALPKDWNVISLSFEDFLEKLIDEKGKQYWL